MVKFQELTTSLLNKFTVFRKIVKSNKSHQTPTDSVIMNVSKLNILK
jgi:hypothetical protein